MGPHVQVDGDAGARPDWRRWALANGIFAVALFGTVAGGLSAEGHDARIAELEAELRAARATGHATCAAEPATAPRARHSSSQAEY